MPHSEEFVPLAGSAYDHAAGTRLVGDIDPLEVVEVTVRVRPQFPDSGPVEIGAMTSLPVDQRRYPSREEYATAHGADPDAIAKVESFARAHGLEVREVSLPRRSLVLSSSAQAMSAAFHVSLGRYQTESGFYRGSSGPVQLTTELAPIVESVIGLDNRPHAQHRAPESP